MIGVAVWHSGLTKNQSNEIEKIQKVAFRIILGENYISYDAACILLNVMPLRYRRTELCTSFAIKLYKSSRSADFFLPAKRNVNLRNKNKNLVIEQKCNTKRLYNAPHNYLARLINDNTQKISKWKWWHTQYSEVQVTDIEKHCNLWTIGAAPSFLFCSNIYGA